MKDLTQIVKEFLVNNHVNSTSMKLDVYAPSKDTFNTARYVKVTDADVFIDNMRAVGITFTAAHITDLKKYIKANGYVFVRPRTYNDEGNTLLGMGTADRKDIEAQINAEDFTQEYWKNNKWDDPNI